MDVYSHLSIKVGAPGSGHPSLPLTTRIEKGVTTQEGKIPLLTQDDEARKHEKRVRV